MGTNLSRRESFGALGALFATPLVGCATSIHEGEIGEGKLKGRVLVEWIRQDEFIYRKTSDPLTFSSPSIKIDIVPDDIYTNGGSIPRVFWGIPGLSPWGLGPAYIIHDWLFQAHRCGYPFPEAGITFKQSAVILAEVGKALIASGLIDHDLLDEIVWGVSTRYAKNLWDKPKPPSECIKPPSRKALGKAAPVTVADFRIPPQNY